MNRGPVLGKMNEMGTLILAWDINMVRSFRFSVVVVSVVLYINYITLDMMYKAVGDKVVKGCWWYLFIDKR